MPPDRLQAQALVKLLDDRLRGARGKKVNVGALESTYGTDLLTRFDDAWTGKGGKIGEKVTIAADQTVPRRRRSRNSAPGEPDAWVFFDFQDTYARLANDLVPTRSPASAQQDVRHGRPRHPAAR